MSQPLWQAVRDRKLRDVASKIPQEWQISPSRLPSLDTANVTAVPRDCDILTAKELHITEDYDATSLIKDLRTRALTALEVTTAFCKRAAICHQLTNCLTEPLFTSALARAEYLDAYLVSTGAPLGPLHGIPISVKDTFHIRGVDSSIGIAALAFKPASINAPIVDLLLKAGAIIHCKTNVPQTLLALDSVNNIFGRTLNPLDRQKWTAGGSSGGEGVLVALRGCVLGIGTDVGGSVRIPAMCNGIIGFKPSVGRLPASGQEMGQLESAGSIGLEASVGVIARGLEDVDILMKAIEAGRAWEVDAGTIPGKWWSDEGIEKITFKRRPLIGIVKRDGVTEPLPPVQRALDDVVGRLKKNGIEVVEIDAKRFKDCQSLANRFFGVEGGNYLMDLLEQTGEPLIPWLASRLKRKTPANVDSLRELHARRKQLQDDFLQIWRDSHGRNIDAFICPVAPHPVPPIDRWNGISYTGSLVLLDYPAATLPIRSLVQADLEGEMIGEPIGPWDKINRELWNTRTINRNAYLGSPLSIQVVGPRLQEKHLWNAMMAIEDAIRDRFPAAKL